MQSFNYHTHVERCGHAKGNEEDMILAAIDGGFKVIGISDHLPFPDWPDLSCRMPLEQMDEYLATLRQLKEKYADQIQVLIGFETEFFEDSVEYYRQVSDKCDYLVFGQHNPSRKFAGDYNQEPYCNDEYIELMATQLCQAMDLGLTKYVCHLDYFLLDGCELSDSHMKSLEKIARCALKNDVVLEINLKGPIYGKHQYKDVLSYRYPNTLVFEMVAKIGCKVCFGYDAHYPDALRQREIELKVKEDFQNLKLNFVSEPFL